MADRVITLVIFTFVVLMSGVLVLSVLSSYQPGQFLLLRPGGIQGGDKESVGEAKPDSPEAMIQGSQDGHRVEFIDYPVVQVSQVEVSSFAPENNDEAESRHEKLVEECASRRGLGGVSNCLD